MRYDIKTLAIEEIKDRIQYQLNQVNAVKELCLDGNLTDDLVEDDLMQGKYKLSGSVDLEFTEEKDPGNSRITLSNVRYIMSSQIKDKLRQVIHNKQGKVICGTTSDITLQWINEEGQEPIYRTSGLKINNDFKVVKR